MEVAGRGEGLADQGGADDLAIARDEAAVGLGGEDRLAEAGDREGIEEPGDRGQDHDHHEGGAELLQHGFVLQARPMAVMARSISLMPMNGTISPPRP